MRKPVTIAIAAFLLLPAGAHAAYPGRNGKLVFFQAGIGGVEPVGLAVADADGRHQSPEPIGPACGGEGDFGAPGPCPGDPAWSPDGLRIAFALGGTVATMRPDGGDVRRLPLTGYSRVSSPTWSPEGSRIAFAARRGGNRNVFVTTPLGSPVIQLTRAGGTDPAWSVRNEIAFVRRADVHRIRNSGRKARRLTFRGGAQPTWSPTGNELAFVRRGVLFRLGRSGQGLKRLTRGPAVDPSWTPSGGRILFVRSEDEVNYVILSVSRNGRGRRLVTAGFEGRRVAVLEPDQQPLP